ncbi:MAG: GtrA family protein, partial [Pseudomonadota bacterium]
MERTLKPYTLWIGQAVKFGAVGLLNTALDLGLYFALTRWVGLAAVFAKSISYGAGILNSFYWNKSWTFRSKASAQSTLLPFILVNLAGLAINT